MAIPLALTIGAAGCSDSNKNNITPDVLYTPIPGVGAPAPTAAPTAAATASATAAPTTAPTGAATTAPSAAPSTAASSTPTTAPSSAATTAPTAAIVVTPATLDFPDDPSAGTACASYNAAQTFTATEAGYSGIFTASIDKTGDATVTLGSNDFVVTPTATTKPLNDLATVTVKDTNGQTATVAVTFSGNHICLP